MLSFDRNLFIKFAHSGGMMGWRYWTMGRHRVTKREGLGENVPWSRDGRLDPDLYDDRLPLATAVPLWGVISMLGWLILAEAAVHLAQLAAHY